MRFLATLSLALVWLSAQAAPALLIRHSPLAGSQFYALDDLWPQIRVGDRLALVREPNHRHDKNAIRIEWQGRQIGYVPRAHNAPLAAALDRGQRLVARVYRLNSHPDPWQRVEFAVYAPL